MGEGIEGLTADTFVKKAGNLSLTFEAMPCEFESGSFGWIAHCKQEKKINGKPIRLQINCNAPIRGTKNLQEKDPELDEIDTKAIEKHLKVIGPRTKRRDDLTKIRGIGPWIQERLARIGITTFQQISKMTPEIERDVNVAIKYFLGRATRDEWVLQAKSKVKASS